jgi:hypothetical protein
MTGWDVSKMRASHSARYTSTTALQSSTGYSRVWTEGVLCLTLAGLVDPQDGSARPLSTRSARSQPLAELTIPYLPNSAIGKVRPGSCDRMGNKNSQNLRGPILAPPERSIFGPGMASPRFANVRRLAKRKLELQ